MNLTTEQFAAIQAMTGFALHAAHGDEIAIEAPAGAGKTTLICEAVKTLANHGCVPRVITFTRRAAAELRARGCDATTIYALAAEGMNDQDLARVCTEDVRDLVFARWQAKHGYGREVAKRLWEKVGPALLQTEAMLLHLPRDGRCWIVDEAQDCTEAEVKAIADHAGRVIWVGDPWQRIYEWRGAVGIDCPASACLTVNHRSDCSIVERAKEISGRPEVTAGATEPNGKTAWLCRTNIEAARIAKELNIYQVTGHDRHALACLQIEAAACLDCDWAIAYREAPNWESAVRALHWRVPGVDLRSPRLFLVWLRTHDLQDQVSDTAEQVMTIHAAKGLQFEQVNLCHWKHRNDEDKRLEYVAVTRATHRLVEYASTDAALAARGK